MVKNWDPERPTDDRAGKTDGRTHLTISHPPPLKKILRKEGKNGGKRRSEEGKGGKKKGLLYFPMRKKVFQSRFYFSFSLCVFVGGKKKTRRRAKILAIFVKGGEEYGIRMREIVPRLEFTTRYEKEKKTYESSRLDGREKFHNEGIKKRVKKESELNKRKEQYRQMKQGIGNALNGSRNVLFPFLHSFFVHTPPFFPHYLNKVALYNETSLPFSHGENLTVRKERRRQDGKEKEKQ